MPPLQPVASRESVLCPQQRFLPGSIGGPAARLAGHSIKKVVVDYDDLRMEAIWKIQVEDLPAFVIINHEGRDLDTELPGGKLQSPPRNAKHFKRQISSLS